MSWWYDVGAIGTCCCIGRIWSAHSECSSNGDYECHTNNWHTVQTEVQLKYCQCSEVCIPVVRLYCMVR